MTNPHENYEAPMIEVVGSIHDVTKGGDVPVNEFANQPNVNDDAYPPITPPIGS